MRHILIILPLAFLFSCKNDPLDVDTSGVKTKPLEVLRLEDRLFALNGQNISQETAAILKDYGPVYDHYLMSFMLRKGTRDTSYKRSVLSFIADRDVRETYDYVKKIYTPEKLREIKEGLDEAIKRFAYHFPERRVPARLITCTTGWNYPFALLDSAFLLGLDMYMGDTAKFYQMLRTPQYQVRKMNESYILSDIARGWLITEFDTMNAEATLLGHTIFYGKLFYAVKALLPDMPDSVIIGYSDKHMNYCKTYEKNLWGYFAEKDRLFESNLATIRELTTDGPFTGAISKDCPPRIAMWVGWQIIRSYMQKNEKVTLRELMAKNDPREILRNSKYRP